MKTLLLLALFAVFAYAAGAYDRPYGNKHGSRSPVYARHGMACTSQPLATQAAISILRRGGNAVDAAVGAAAVLAVVEPMMTGPGGDLFALVWDNKEKRLHGLNASGFSPAAVNLEFFRKRGLKQVPPHGMFPVTVPGALDGWSELIAKYGTMKLADVLAPAIDYAENGYPVSEIIAGQWATFSPALSPEAKAVYFVKDGNELRPPRAGEVFRNPKFAATLRRIAEQGRDAFYKGDIARQIVATAQAHDWPMTMEDLAYQHSSWVEPIRTNYRGYDVVEMPPNGQGIAALEMLNILENFDLRKMGHNSADYLHVLVEAKKLAFADRDAFIADPEREHVPVAEMLSKERAKRQAASIDMKKAIERPAPSPLREGPGQDDTVYLTVADGQGNAISLINSLSGAFGSGMVAGDTGMLLQNRGALFSLDEKSPNRIEGRKRPFHTIIPAMLFRNGKPLMSFGVMGGPMQPQGHVQIVLDIVDFGMNLQEAGDAPRFFHQGRGLSLESGIGEDVRKELAARGHRLGNAHDVYGGYQAIWLDTEHGVLIGASDPRKDGQAAGW